MPGIIPFFRRFAPFKPGGRGPALRDAHEATSIAARATPGAGRAQTASGAALASQLNIRMYAQQLRSSQVNTVQATGQFTAKAFDRIQDHADSQDGQLRVLADSVDELSLPGLLKVKPTPSDPGCAIDSDIGKIWVDSADVANTHVKVCVVVASAPTWVVLI